MKSVSSPASCSNWPAPECGTRASWSVCSSATGLRRSSLLTIPATRPSTPATCRPPRRPCWPTTPSSSISAIIGSEYRTSRNQPLPVTMQCQSTTQAVQGWQACYLWSLPLIIDELVSNRAIAFAVTSARTTTKRTKLSKKKVKSAATCGAHSNCRKLSKFFLVRLMVHPIGYAATHTSVLSVKYHTRWPCGLQHPIISR